MRTNLSIPHLYAAARFSRHVAQVERQHDKEPLGAYYDEILHFSSACILTAVAALELHANELFADRASVFPNMSADLLHHLWKNYEQKSITEKFQLALVMRNAPKLPMGSRPGQDIDVLLALRNALMHFKPEWHDEAVKHRALSQKLRGKFKPSPLFPNELVFPHTWATHGCTKWAVERSVEFLRKFERRAQLAPRDWQSASAQLPAERDYDARKQ